MLDAVSKPQDIRRSLERLFTFLWLVVRGFMRNQGLLLSGALAYYTLLSIVPMSILFLVGLSNFIAEEQLLHTLSTYTGMVIPGYSAILAEQVQIFLQHRQAVGIIGFLTMLFFSSMAFAVLQSALSVIFFHPVRITPRNFILSAVIPYAYVFSIALGIVLFSLIAIAFQTLGKSELTLFGMSVNLEATSRIALYALGVICEVALLSSIYLIMPAVRTTFRHALIGGITAAILWEVIRHALIWYYSALSMVNIIYGSFATAVVALLVTEAAALILLLGAQVIAELERKTHESTDESKPIRKGVTAMKRIRMSVGCFVLIMLVAFLGASASTANCESTGEYIDDSVITTKVKSLLASDDFIKSFQISVETYKGTVQMTGVVDSQKALDKAGEIARSVAGVKSVRNDLLVK